MREGRFLHEQRPLTSKRCSSRAEELLLLLLVYAPISADDADSSGSALLRAPAAAAAAPDVRVLTTVCTLCAKKKRMRGQNEDC